MLAVDRNLLAMRGVGGEEAERCGRTWPLLYGHGQRSVAMARIVTCLQVTAVLRS